VYTRGLSVGLAVLFVGISFLSLANGFASAGSQAQMSTGFESGWDSNWSANDYNSASGLDYWGISSYRSYSGTHSAYCAEVGTNSVNSIANNVNHYYDQDMNAWLEIPIGDISAWSSAAFSFYAWYVTGSWSLADYLTVANSSDGTHYWIQWTQTDLSSTGWQSISFSLSTSTTSVAFIFISDPTVGLGPYEGVYIDDIVVTVTDSQVPTSSVGSLSQFQTTSSFSVPYTASDLGGSGLAYVELYYRLGTSGAFTLYTPSTNPSGHWTASPLIFDSSSAGGDGQYQFYTCAVDNSGNHESAPSNPDAATIVDSTKPSTAIGLAGTIGTNGWYRSLISVTLVSTDTTSGVALTTYSLDSGDWLAYLTPLSISQEGIHTLDFYSVDNAGNAEIQKSATIKVDTIPPELVITHPVNDTCVYGDLSITWQCSDSNGIVKTEIKFDAWDWQTVAGTTYGTMLTDGDYSVQVRVTDAAGNQAVRSVAFTADSTPPDLVIVSPAGITPSTDTYLKSVDSIAWQCSDENGIATREVKIDSSAWQNVTTDSFAVQLANGPHMVSVRVTDLAGNPTLCIISFVVDSAAPEITISSPLMDSKISKNEVTVYWNCEDLTSGTDHFEVQVDGGNWIKIVGVASYQLTGLKDGWHSFTVKAVDRAGNTATSTTDFGIYTSIWSQNGPYQGIPLFAVIAAIIIGAVVIALLFRRKKGGLAVATVPKEEASPQTP